MTAPTIGSATLAGSMHVARRPGAIGWPLTLALLGVATFVLGAILFARTPFVAAGDDAMYLILAKSLATGQGYRFLHLPGAPAATHFPPGYPALLALLWRLAPDFPGNVPLFRLANAVCLAIIAVSVARLTRRLTGSPAWGSAAGALTAVSAPLLVLGNMLLSELFFLALLLPLLPPLERFAADEPRSARDGLATAALLGVAVGLLVLVRTHAIALLPAVVLPLALRRRWRESALFVAAAIGCVVPWQVFGARHTGAVPAALVGEYGSYLGWWMRGFAALGPRMILMTLARTTSDTAGMLAILFSPLRSDAGHAATLAALVLVLVAGVVACGRELRVALLFLAGYLGIVALWPFPPSRFVWGVWPLLVVLLLAGARALLSRAPFAAPRAAPRRLAAAGGALAVLWLAAGHASYEARAIRGRWWSSIPRANAARIVPAVRWTLARTAPGDLVASEDEGALYLYTGRRTVPIRTFSVEQYLITVTPRMDAEQGLLPVLDAYPVRAVIASSATIFAEAQWAATRPAPRIAPLEEFAGGVAYTVLPR